VESDGGGAGVAGAGWFVGFLDAVVVVAGGFDGAGAGAVAAAWDAVAGDGLEQAGEGVSPVLRGECPPSRWRCGGPGGGSW
jgi:hypothetical protein